MAHIEHWKRDNNTFLMDELDLGQTIRSFSTDTL